MTERSFFSSEFDELRSTIEVLLGHGCPVAIPLAVPFIVVFTVDSFADGPFPHVGKEFFKALPARTNRNPTPSVARVFFVLGVETALNHPVPALVGLGLTARLMTVSDVCFVT